MIKKKQSSLAETLIGLQNNVYEVFHFRVDPFQKGGRTTLKEFAPLKRLDSPQPCL